MSSPAEADPLTSHFSLRVRFAETDLMGIVHHANYLVYCEAARVDWLHKRGISYQAWMEHGVQLPVVEASSRFKKAARFDDVLDIATSMSELRRVTVRFRYRITRAAELICETETMQACVGDNMTLKRFPADVSQVLQSAESHSA